MVWEDARTECDKAGGFHLATIDDEGENEALFNLFAGMFYIKI